MSRNKTFGQIDVHGSLLEGKRHQFLAKPDKIKFLNEPKQTELAKHKHCVNTMHTIQHMCDLRHDSCYTIVKQLCSTLFFFLKKYLL